MADSEGQVDGDDEQSSEPNLGKLLRDARESRELSIEEIATELRIEARLLRALEEGQFDTLGAPVFAKGYLKQYGTRLGLDYRDLLALYYQVVGSTEVEITPSPVIKLRDERQITVWVVAALVIALVAVFLLVWWMDQPDPVGAPTFTPAEPSEALPADLERAAPPAELAPSAAEPEAVAAANAAPTGATPEPVPTVSEPFTPDDEPLEDSAIAAESPAPVGDAAPAPPADPPATPAGALQVELVFVADCWAEISDAAGVRHFYGLGEAGASEAFAAVPPVRFLLGNAGGVEITIDGRRYPIPGGGGSGDLARFSVDSLSD